MRRDSILFTLTVTFVITLILLVISFLILIGHSIEERDHHIKKKYSPVARMVLREHFENHKATQPFINAMDEIGFTYSEDKKEISALKYNPKTKVEFERFYRDILFRVLQLKGEYYIYLKQEDNRFEIILKDTQAEIRSGVVYLMAVFTLLLIGMCFAYLTTYRKIYPLKQLKEKVMNLAEENFDIQGCDTNKNDEVSALAREFKKAAQRLKEIKESRNVFIRNIMHELKTPITKGKFLTQLPHDEQNDEKMKNVFNRLESLINEFSSIEELISSSKHFEKSYFYLNDIVDNAVDILMLEEDEIKCEFENLKLHVNFKLMTLAVKNLIDNAIKYSPNKQVCIKTQGTDIVFENEGEPLKYDLKSYFEPFFANEQKNKQSFGLGLYIVHSILNASDYSLQYTHENGINQFKIVQKEHV